MPSMSPFLHTHTIHYLCLTVLGTRMLPRTDSGHFVHLVWGQGSEERASAPDHEGGSSGPIKYTITHTKCLLSLQLMPQISHPISPFLPSEDLENKSLLPILTFFRSTHFSTHHKLSSAPTILLKSHSVRSLMIFLPTQMAWRHPSVWLFKTPQ